VRHDGFEQRFEAAQVAANKKPPSRRLPCVPMSSSRSTSSRYKVP
jgi:hypothetical protein